jgi:sugar lactone lactonase YvrE
MGSGRFSRLAVVVVAAVVLALPSVAAAHRGPRVSELATFAAPGCTGTCGSGSTIGPDGALYVTDGQGGRVLRVDVHTGAVTTFAEGLPLMNTPPGIGGAIDIAFVGRTAYVLVANVGALPWGEPDEVAGIYRIGRDGRGTPIADIYSWAVKHPPALPFALPGGVQYALEPFRGGFVVTDGHHNRLIRVRRNGKVSELLEVGNVVPTGLAARGRTLFVGLAGPVPHLPEDGKVMALTPRSSALVEIASGAPLVVDVELSHRRLYALSQGIWDLPPEPANAGKPASPDTGSLARVTRHGRLSTVVEGLDRPTSVAFSHRKAYVVTLTGKVLKIRGVR